jgi:TrkA domain protein
VQKKPTREDDLMDITQTTVRGAGTLHDGLSRRGQQIRIFVKEDGGRELYIYPPTGDDDWTTVELDDDEADLVADLLHSRPIPDRMADLERRLSELSGAR